jgi:CRP/FNR family transcriptional regulator
MTVIRVQGNIDSKVEFLKNTSLLSSYPEDEIRRFAGLCIPCSFKKGDIIFREGEKSEYVYIYRKGRIKYFSYTPAGKIIVARFTNSADLGGIANLYSGSPRWLSSQAMEDIDALKIYRKDLLDYLRHDPELALKIQGIMERFLHGIFNRFKTAVVSPVEQRVFDIIYELHERFGTTLPLRDEDIAELVGTTRETTVRAMKRLKLMGIVRSNRCKIDILDIEALRELKKEYPSI